MLAVLRVGDDPGHGGKRSGGRGLEEGLVRQHVPELMVLVDRGEVRQWRPDLRGPNEGRLLLTRGLPVVAVVMAAGVDVVRPRHSGPVQEVRDVRVGEAGQLPALVREVGLVVVGSGPDGDAAHRVRRPAASRGPGSHHVEVCSLGGPAHRLEHVVLQRVVPRVGPVVRDLAGVVVAHEVRVRADRHERVLGAARHALLPGQAAGPQEQAEGFLQRLLDEAVHPSVVHVDRRAFHVVRPAQIVVVGVVEGADTLMGPGVRDAHGGDAVLHRDAVGPGVGPEVGVERPVLLHDHDDVVDLHDPLRLAAAGARRRGERGQQHQRERERHGTRRARTLSVGRAGSHRMSGKDRGAEHGGGVYRSPHAKEGSADAIDDDAVHADRIGRDDGT